MPRTMLSFTLYDWLVVIAFVGWVVTGLWLPLAVSYGVRVLFYLLNKRLWA